MSFVLCKPTSVVTSGGSSSISANGSVSFTNATSVSLNGVFKSDFRFYKILLRTQAITSALSLVASLRSAGTDNTSSYTTQIMTALSTSNSAFNTTAYNGAYVNRGYGTWAIASELWVYSPFVAQPTTFLFRGVSDYNYGSIHEGGARHSVSASYDGITFGPGVAFTGTVAVYGISQ